MAYVVVIDDDEDLATATATVLRDSGHDVRIEFDIRNAESVLEERRPDLIVLDVMFPGDLSAGFVLARKIRHDYDKLKGVPVIMLTAVNKALAGLNLASCDIDDHWLPVAEFLDKPVDPVVLKEKVATLLAAK
ncbi:MAG: response regulator transcription factor [Planctomycetota bacterium]|jgi:CheY-like chemotaxis protein